MGRPWDHDEGAHIDPFSASMLRDRQKFPPLAGAEFSCGYHHVVCCARLQLNPIGPFVHSMSIGDRKAKAEGLSVQRVSPSQNMTASQPSEMVGGAPSQGNAFKR